MSLNRRSWIGCAVVCGAVAIVGLGTGTARANTITVSFTGMDGAVDASCTLTEALTGGFTECAPTGPAGPLVILLPAGTRTWTATTGHHRS